MKKLISFLLTIVMMLAVMPAVFAENDGNFDLYFDTDFRSENITASAVYKPSASETAEFTGILALYSADKQLLNVITAESIQNKAEMSLQNQADASFAKAFAWSSESSVIPLVPAVSLTKTDRIIPGVKYLDFTVDVEEGREPVILQLTDTQIIDAAQERTADRLSSSLDSYYANDQMDERCFNYVRETVQNTNPDLILITGDLVYGEFDDAGTALPLLIEVMESFKIPWAPVFGNHDNESAKGADWQCDLLENAPYCLFEQKTLTGNGNYSIGITQGGTLKRVFFMLDSNGCGGMSEATRANGHSKTSVGFGSDQIAWYTDVATKINAAVPDMKYSFAYHIQQEIFRTAISKYGTVNSDTINNPINIDTHPNKAATDFGYMGRNLKSGWDTDFTVYNGMKALGADSIFVGHEHCNSASVVYDGVRFQYGQKSSCYDRANYIKADGTITGSYSDAGTPIMGGTVMKMSETDGSFTDCFIYYCDTNEEVVPPDESVTVPGMQFGKELSLQHSNMTQKGVLLNNIPAYQISATEQGKVYIDTSVVTGQKTFTFSVLVPEGAPKLDGQGEISIRYKSDGAAGSGYIRYESDSTNEDLKLNLGQWQTFTADISQFSNTVTEFSFVIPKGGTVYLKDLSVSSQAAGLSFDAGQLTYESALSIETKTVDGEKAFAVTANSQGKVLVKPELLANKSTFTFSVYLPEDATNQLSGYGEFAIRVKPNNKEPNIDGKTNGYIDFASDTSVEVLKLTFGEWRTYTIDISTFGAECTEFAFVIAKGNTIYLKDLIIQ